MQQPGFTPHFTIIELTGHIIDSLILTKVIDLIQTAGCRYQINDIQIGQRKNDLSYAQFSLWCDEPEVMELLLAELKAHGALPVETTPVQLAPCPADGVLPEGAYVRLNPPTELWANNQWISVTRQGFDIVIVMDPTTNTAVFRKASDVKAGDQVVIGKSGVKILPTLGETAHAQPVAG